jgi:hypothetical protein
MRDLRALTPPLNSTMPITVKTFDPARTNRKLQARSRGFSTSIEDELERAGRLISISLATSAQPYGIDSSARTKGEAATSSDIRHVYATPGNVFENFTNEGQAAAFWKAIKTGNFSRAEKLMQAHAPSFSNKTIKPFDGGQAHRAARNNRGRVSRKQEPVFVVQSTRALSAYVKSEVDHVGEGKGGWAACAKILGGSRGLPQWVTRHAGKRSAGFVGKDYRANVKRVRLENRVAYAQNLLSPGDKSQSVAIGIERMTRGILIAERRTASANRF